MYKPYVIMAEKPNHEDTIIYWDSSEAEVISDIAKLKARGYTEITSFKMKVEEVFDEDSGKFLKA